MRALQYIQSQPWMILPEYLDLMVEIASRDRSIEDAAKGIAEARRIADERANSPAALAIKKGEPLGDNNQVRVREGVGIISVIGPISRYSGFFSDISGGTSTERLAQNFAQAEASKAVNSILLFIDSPGGEAFGIPEMAQMIHASKKPVAAYVGGYGASAALYLASAADEIVVDSGALLGSIGTVMEATDYSKAYEQRGVKKHQYVSEQSPKKRPKLGTEAGDAQMQEIVNDLAQVFVEDVARFRGVTVEKVLNDFGQGGLLSAQKAVSAGLADRIGSFESLLSEMAAGKKRKKMRPAYAASTQPATGANLGGVEMSTEKKGWFARLFASLSDEEKQEAAADILQAGVKSQTQAPAPPAAAQESDEVKQLRAENEKLKKGQREQRRATLKAEAESFINPKILACEVLPAVKEGFISAYVQAGLDDDAAPIAEGKSRVEMLKAQYEGRDKHQLAGRTVKTPATAAVLSEDTDDDEIKEAQASAKAFAERANGKK